MAFTLTSNAEDKQSLNKQQISLILEIDGYDHYFSMDKIYQYIRVGSDNLRVGNSWVIGGSEYARNNYDYIAIDGTTSSISQQLMSDKGGSSSVTSFQINLIDFHEIVTDLISPNRTLTDILGREAYVYLGYKDTYFPQDYIMLFSGIIDEVEAGGTIKLNVSNPEQKKRQDIFPIIETDLSSSINNAVTTIPVTSNANFLLPTTATSTLTGDSITFSTYCKIEDEIINYTTQGTNTLTGATRAQFATIAASHNSGTSVAPWYRLQGNAIDLALSIMLSSADNIYYKTGIDIANFGIDAEGNVGTNTIFFAGIDVTTKLGFNVGDYLTTTGATNAGNNFTLRTITSIDIDANGSVVTVNGSALTLEANTSAVASIKSQYNLLPDGLGLGNHQVDIAEYERIYTLFNGSIPTYDFYITETVNAKEFIEKEILFPANLFALPKKGKISVGVVSPPLAIATLPRLNSDNVTKPDTIRIKRAIGKYFYNTVIYKYNYDAVETNKPLTGLIVVDEDSKAQIPVGTKAITIASKGMRNDANTSTILDINSRRILSKYKYAAEAITLNVFYGIGFNIDVGDIVYFGDTDLNLPDTVNGVRGFSPRLCEVIDKKMNIFQGTVQLTIIDTSYLTNGRYGIISPSSIVGTGSTTTNIIITDSYSTTFPDIEKNKWQDYIGQNLYIHDDTYTTTYSTKLLGFDPSNNYSMIVSPMSGSPTAGMIVDIAFYPMTTVASDNELLKNIFVFTDPSVAVVSGVSSTEFVVGAGDISKFLVGQTIILHNVDWSSYSSEVKISQINTNNIVVDRTLGFTPSSSYTVELIGYKDGGNSYRFL